ELGERVLDPRQHAVAVVVAPGGLLHDDRDDAERERGLLVAPPDGRDPLGLRLDHGLAERVGDRDRERGRRLGGVDGAIAVTAVAAGVAAGAGGEDQGGGNRDGGRERARDAHVSSVSGAGRDRKSTRLNSSHVKISYAVFCLKKKTKGGR